MLCYKINSKASLAEAENRFYRELCSRIGGTRTKPTPAEPNSDTTYSLNEQITTQVMRKEGCAVPIVLCGLQVG